MAMNEDETPDNLTVASASFIADDDQHDMSHYSAGHRKRKREEMIQDMTEQQHSVYGDELLDYFLLSRNEQPAIRPEPPTNFQPNWIIDTERHTALHWASAMGDIAVIKQLKQFGASLAVQNVRGETPLMRAVNFTNCYEKQTFPAVVKELFDTVEARDHSGCTVIHHAAVMKSGRVTSHSCSRYYLDNILNRLQETYDPNMVQQLMDAQDNDGNTAVHLAAQRNASKCIRALLGRGASTDIPNHDGIRAEDLIKELNANRKGRAAPGRSSSPFAPDSQHHAAFHDVHVEPPPHGLGINRLAASYQSEAANTVQSRITPLILEKFQDLAQSYDDEFKEKDEAEKEARRILLNTQGELASVRAQMADLETLIEPDDVAVKVSADANMARKQVLQLVTHQNRIAVQDAVEQEISVVMNGDGAGAGANGDLAAGEDTPETRRQLANELRQLLLEHRQAEADYVEALGVVGTGEKIEKYRRLLRICLGEEADSLDDNVDGIIQMMEEEAADALHNGGVGGESALVGGIGGGEPMDIATL